MLQRRKSTLHQGEEGGEHAKITTGVAVRELRSSRRSPECLEGLRILIQKAEKGSHVVIKSSLKTYRALSKAPSQLTNGTLESGFLKTCFLCKKELSPNKDVFMYRGDQGFCSEECRCQQILLDERRELDFVPHHRHAASTKVHASDRRQRRILVVG